jgi:hypothetical protein
MLMNLVTPIRTDAGLRHYCRNPKCRMKLKTRASNAREAFCTRSCYRSFYRHRCVICEQPMERRTENQLVCGKRRCRNALDGGFDGGRYLSPSRRNAPAKAPDSIDPKAAPAPDRAWRIVAGPERPAVSLRAATVADGFRGRWAGGEFQRVEAKNRRALKDAAESVAGGSFTDPDWREATSPDGVVCFVVDHGRPASVLPPAPPHHAPKEASNG